MRLSLLIAFGIGIIWMGLVHCMPNIISILAIVLGSLTLLVGGILLIADNSNGWLQYGPWKIIIAVFLLIFGVLFLFSLFFYKRRIKLTGIFLSYASKFLGQKPVNFIFIPIFIICLAGLIVLCLF